VNTSVGNLSTTLIIAFVIYIAAFGQLGNYATIATTSAWGAAPPTGSTTTSGTGSNTLSTIGSAVSGVGSILKAIPLIGGLF
jgi:hypothetical protein